LMILFW